jgi:hypothetical protein
MLDLIRPLIQLPADWQHYNIDGKFFLPLMLREPLLPLLPKSAFDVTIRWDEEGLRALVERRFRAAGAYYRGFDDLAGPNLEDKLDDLLIRSAAGSPRHLLEIINLLLDKHAERDSQDRQIQLADWRQAAEAYLRANTTPSSTITETHESHSESGHEPTLQVSPKRQRAWRPDSDTA